MLTKMAKRHHIGNFNTLVSVFGMEVMEDINVLNKRFFYRDPTKSHPIRIPGALLEKIVPRDLSEMKSSNYMRKFFEETVLIEPSYIVLNNMNLLIPRMEEILIENKSLKNPASIDFILSSTPEIIFFVT